MKRHFFMLSRALNARKRKIFALFFALVASIGLSWASELTVADGTKSNNCVPYDGYSGDCFQRVQIIYPQSELAAMAGKDITSLTFYVNSQASSALGVKVQIGLAEISDSDFSAGNAYKSATLTIVKAEDVWDLNAATVVVEFSKPFRYSGEGNILFDIQTVAKGGYGNTSFYGVGSLANYQSAYSYAESSIPATSSNRYKFIPKTTFTYEEPAPVVLADCELSWMNVPEGGVVGTIGHEDEIVLPYFTASLDFMLALDAGTATLRLGSTDESVLAVNGFNDFTVNGVGECDVYIVHDEDAVFAYDSAAFHVTVNPEPTPVVNVKLIEFQVPASWENDNSPITSADFPDFVATTYEIASALPVTSEPSLVVFDFPEIDEMSVYTKVGGQVSDPSTGTIYRESFFGQTQLHYYYPVLASDEPEPQPTTYTLQLVADPTKGSVAVTNLLGSDIIDNGNGNFTVPANAEVTILATPNNGYEFSGWKVGNIDEMVGCYYCGTALNTLDNPLTITMTADAAYLAEFEAATPTAIENVQTNQVPSNQVQSTKVIRNGQLFIIRDGKLFNAQGVEVR